MSSKDSLKWMKVAKMPDVVFWQNEISIHQAALISAFSDSWTGNVTLIVNVDLPPRRILQGWSRPNFGKANVFISPSSFDRKKLVEQMPSDTIHVFSGLGREKKLRLSHRYVRKITDRIVYYLEPWDSSTFRRRVLLRIFYASMIIVEHSKRGIFLSTGVVGIRQLKSIGIRDSQIYPFGYFLDSKEQHDSAQVRVDESTIELIFIGELNRNKQALLLATIACSLNHKIRISYIGDGPDRAAIEILANDHPSKIRVLGSIPNDQIAIELRKYDYLILPSMYDGWGAVVSESLLEGTPVLVSNACGSSQVITQDKLGYSFVPSEFGISRIFDEIVTKGKTDLASRSFISSWADERISGVAGGQYLAAILTHEFEPAANSPRAARPMPPWFTTNDIGMD